MDDNSDSRDFLCPKYCTYTFGGESWQLAYDIETDSPGGVVSSDLRDQLFGQPSSSCQQTWDFDSCNLGVSVADVFGGRNGWQELHAWVCGVDVLSHTTVHYCNQQR